MIIKEIIELNGIQYAYHFSNKDFYIERNGSMYSEAIDPLDSERKYIETNKKIEENPEKYRKQVTLIIKELK